MNYLQAVLRSDTAPEGRAMAVVAPEARDIVYVDQPATIELITEALKAWGIRVRAERDQQSRAAKSPPAATVEANWQTTRSESKAPTRLENTLSPLWLPIRTEETDAEPVGTWSWFGRAA